MWRTWWWWWWWPSRLMLPKGGEGRALDNAWIGALAWQDVARRDVQAESSWRRDCGVTGVPHCYPTGASAASHALSPGRPAVGQCVTRTQSADRFASVTPHRATWDAQRSPGQARDSKPDRPFLHPMLERRHSEASWTASSGFRNQPVVTPARPDQATAPPIAHTPRVPVLHPVVPFIRPSTPWYPRFGPLSSRAASPPCN